MPPNPSPAEPIEKRAVIFFGMTASGKSFLAKRWAQLHGFPYFNTDVVRKKLVAEMALQPVESGINAGIYSQEFTEQTYDNLFRSVREILTGSGQCTVIIDGSFTKRKYRDRLRSVLEDCCHSVFIYCYCAEEITKKRLALRREDASAVSDGTWEVFLHQRDVFEPPTEMQEQQLLVLDTNQPIEKLIAALEKQLL